MITLLTSPDIDRDSEHLMPKPPRLIAQNKKAYFDFHVEDELEAGLELHGWEVKSLRAGRVNLKDSYAIIHNEEAWLLNAHISPLPEVSTHIQPDPRRTRRLLLHRGQIRRLLGKIQEKGYTLVPLELHWRQNLVKVTLALARGKKKYDKRQAIKERDWNRERQRILKGVDR